MKKVIVTPAGRKRYLEVLLKNLLNLKDEFDSWEIWLNTENEEDIKYIENIEKIHDFIEIRRSSIPINGSLSIHQFFKYCIDPQSLYLRLDDDIVFIKENSIRRIFEERNKSSNHFLLYGNVFNNVLMSHLQQRIGNIPLDFGNYAYHPLDINGWQDGHKAEKLHRIFFDLYREKNINKLNLPDWIFKDFEWVSINVICWRGEEFNKFSGIVDPDEERWLTMMKTKELQNPNKIVGDTLFVHYAYYPQREIVDSTDILSLYQKISNNEEI